MRVEGNGGEPKVPVQLSVVAESRPQSPWVGLLARKVRIGNVRLAGRFTFPGCSAEWFFEATRLHSQWRDRAGFAPDFPVMPLVGTQGEERMLAHS